MGKKIVIDGAKIRDRAGLFATVKAQLGDEAFLGSNLDALHDVLSAKKEPVRVELRDVESLRESLGSYADRFFRVLSDCGATFVERADSDGAFAEHSDSDGAFAEHSDSAGAFAERADSEGVLARPSDNEGAFAERADSGVAFAKRADSAGVFAKLSDSERAFAKRADSEGAFAESPERGR